ncbi:MAG: SoxR reducing system RseC family protein [Bacteroidaceae bacterium]
MKEVIRHQGVVEQITSTTCSVRIMQQAACNGCSVKHLCKSSESKEKVIEASIGDVPVQVGQSVMVEGAVRQGLKAVWMAYAVPLILMVVVLFLGSCFWNEDVAALLSLVFLLVYYCVLFLFRHRLNKSFRFRVIPFDAGISGFA